METTINPLFGKSLICHLLLIISLCSLPTLSHAQYSEAFSTPNKGYLINTVNDFSGVNWTLTPWATAGGERDATDYFQTTAAGVLESIDLDDEVCWESPLLNISSAGTVSFSVGLVWNGFDNDVVANSCATGSPTSLSLDYIKVMYSINGGAFTMVPNQVGGATCATIGYASGMGSAINGSATVTKTGISGNSLRIRVCVGTNANAELVQIDNVSVPQAGVTLNCSQPVLTTAVKNIVCNGPNSGSIDLSVSGGTPGYTYAWSVPATTQDVSGLAVGTYSVTVTDAAMCSQTTNATISSSPIVQSALTFPASCSQLNGAIDLSVSGGNLPYTYAWTGGATTQDLSGIAAGSYTVTITDASIPACTSTATYSVGTTATSPYSETFSTPNRGYKINQEDDFLGMKWTLSPWTFDEPPTGIGRDNGDYFQTTAAGKLETLDTDQEVCWTSPELNISASGTVQFSVDLAWIGFDPEDYISVQYSLNGGAFISIPNAVGGGAKTIQYTAGGNISSSTTISVPGLSGSKLQIRVCVLTNSQGDIVDIDNISVPQSVSFCFGPTVNAGMDQTLCITNAPVTLAATLSDGTGAWSVLSGPSTLNTQFSSVSSPTATFTPAGGAGTYILRWTGTNSGGASSDDVTIKLDAAAFVNAGVDQTVCASNPVVQLAASFSGATTNIVWSINPPFGAFSNDVSPTSTYTFTAGDIAAGSVTLTINTNDPSGACQAVSDMMTIFIDPKATVNAGADYRICQTQTTFPNLNGQIGGAATSATWSGGTGTFSPNVNTLNAIYTPSPTELANPGSIVLTLTTNDPAGLCGPVSDQVTLLIDAAAFVNAGVDQTVCASNPVVQLAASFSGATTNIVWSINPPFGAFSNDISPTSTYTLTAGDIAAGSVTLTINTNDPAGVCNSVSDMMTIFINQLSTPSVSLSVMPSSTICAGTSVTFTATPTNGGSTPQYKWFKNLIEIVGETNATLTRSDLADQDKIKVQMTSNKTCITTAVVTSFEITMTVNSLSVAPSSISGVSTVCNGDSTTLTLVGGSAGTGATAKWYSGSCGGTPQGTGNSITVAPSTSTTYFVRYEGTCNMTACASQLITVNTLSTAPTSISGTSTVCSGSSTTLTLVGGSAGTGAVAEWFTGLCGGTPAGTGNSITVSPTNNITYYVRYKGTCNTTSCASINVTVKTPSTAPLSISGVSTVCNGDSTTLTLVGGSAGTGATAKWYSGSCGGTPQGTGNSITVAPSSTSTYFVRYEGDCNTTACASQLITVNTLSVAPTSISGVSNICLGNSTTLTLAGGSAGTGAVAEWFTSSCGGTSAGTGNSIIVSPSISTTYFVRYKGTCNTTTCASVTVTITTPSVGGTVSPAQTQGCGPQTVNLSVSGINGVVTRWERQTNCNGAWASIGNAGLSAITVTTPNSSTCYRAVITNGVCPSANSTISTITVDKPAVGGRVTLQSNQMATSIALCPSQNALLIPVGFTGKVANWQYSFGTSSIWYDLPSTEGQTTLTVNGSSISGTVFYRVVIITELSICTGQSSVAYSAAFRITKKAGCTAPDGSTLNNDITTIKGLTIVKAYPNPASELISLDIDNYTATPQNVVTQDALKGSAQLEILDVTGRQVLKQTISLTQGFNTINLDISQLSKGIFIVKMTDSQNQKAWVKMVKE